MALENVFAFTKTHTSERTDVVKKRLTQQLTTTKIISTNRGWRNIFTQLDTEHYFHCLNIHHSYSLLWSDIVHVFDTFAIIIIISVWI